MTKNTMVSNPIRPPCPTCPMPYLPFAIILPCNYLTCIRVEIKEDIQEECSKYGTILEVKIPRPAGVRSSAGVGKIYIKYEDPEKAQTAIKSLAGRQFSRRTVLATEFPEESFDVDAW